MTTLVVDASVWVSAADASDRFHASSRTFLGVLASRGASVFVPAIARLEVACALARRLRDAERARMLADELLRAPFLQEVALDARLLVTAVTRGTGAFLRVADALYAATADQIGAEIVAWDKELVERAGGVTPDAWLARGGVHEP